MKVLLIYYQISRAFLMQTSNYTFDLTEIEIAYENINYQNFIKIKKGVK